MKVIFVVPVLLPAVIVHTLEQPVLFKELATQLATILELPIVLLGVVVQ